MKAKQYNGKYLGKHNRQFLFFQFFNIYLIIKAKTITFSDKVFNVNLPCTISPK